MHIKRILMAAAFIAILAPRLRAEVPPPEKLLPDDTVMVLTIPDYNKMKDVYANSPHGQFWNDPAMHDFKEKFMAKLSSQFLDPMQQQMGVKLADYTNLPQGQITLAFTQNGSQGKEGQTPAMLFLMDTRGGGDKLKKSLEDLRKKWVDAGKTIKTEKIRDLDFSVVTISKDDLKALKKDGDTNSTDSATGDKFENPESKKNEKQTFYIGQSESLLIVGDNSKAIEKVLVRLGGGEIKPLSENPLYSANESIFHGAQGYGWLNTKHLIVDVFAKNTDDSADADNSSPLKMNPKKIMTGLGLTGLDSVAMGYTYAPDGAMLTVSLAAPESTRAGLFKILEGEQKDVSAPAFVPADAVKFQRWRLDGSKTWNTIRKIAAEISPTSVNGIDFVLGSAEGAAKEKDPAFDLKKDLFENLGSDIISYQKNPRGNSLADMSSPPAIYLVGSPNPERLIAAIRSLALLAPQPENAPKDRDFLGHKIYSMPLGTADNSKSLSYTASSGYLAIATDAAILEEYLRSAENPPKPLRDTPGLAEASSKIVSKETSLFGFSNESENMRFLFDGIKKSSADSDPLASLTPLTMAMGMGDTNLKDWLDVSLLPSYDKVSKYFGFSVYSFSANSQGLVMKFYSPTPPGLKSN